MKHLQKLGSALMLPVATLPICGILMGLGYLLCPAYMMGAGWAESLGYATSGLAYSVGFFLIKAGGALIDNMAILFAIGTAVGLAKENNGTAGLAGLVSWLMITNLVSSTGSYAPALAAIGNWGLAYSKIANPFTGILAGVIGAVCYNKFKDTKLPDFLAFFAGKRFVSIITALVSIVVSAILLVAWPIIFGALVAVGEFIVGLDAVGAGIYAFLNRLLIPFGLHHALNNVFWFDTIGLGDLSAYWSGLEQGGVMANGNEITWSVGMYMAGFFPCMMFGIPGAAVAMVRAAKPANRKATIGIVGAAALSAFICGVTEPFEFAFMFVAFPLYIVYAALYGIFTTITVALGFRAGFCFSAGATDLLFGAALPAANNYWVIIPMGIAAFVVFYLVFSFAIKKWDMKTPGREDDQEAETTIELANDDYSAMAAVILEGVGGKENVTSIDHCITRLRLEVKDRLLVDEKKIKSSGAAGVIRPGKTSVQVIIGPKVQFVHDEFKKLCK
ncbi:MAG: PTS transporter subunit EIIC [Oscillospiraceae bacterium]|nr:PTS transporter subunit EIIC [Oscillospiraceae bacterium]